MGLNVAILLMVTKDLPISLRFIPYEFSSRCKFSTRQPMVEFYLLTCSRFPLQTSEEKLCSTRNELTTSALGGVQVTY